MKPAWRGSLRLTRRGALAAGAAALAAPALAILVLQDEALRLEDFGGGTGATDNSTAFRRALATLAARGGGVIQLGQGTYRFASASLGAGGVELPANVTLRGRGKQATRLVVTGRTECYFLLNEGSASGHRVQDLTARGNGIARNSGPGGFYYCSVLRDRARAGVSECVFENVRLENFGGDFWIRFLATHPRHRIAGCGLLPGCEAASERGNARDPELIAVPSFIVEFRADGGTIEDCFVRQLSADLEYVKGAIAAFGNVRRLQIDRPNLRNAFQGYRRPDRGGYAIVLYDSQGIVTDTTITQPVIAAPFSCGIYTAGSKRTQILAPRISGQSDGEAASLPKAAIALNGANDVRIVDADLSDNVCDLDIAGISSADYSPDMNIVVEGGSGRQATDCGVRIRASAFARTCGGIRLTGYSSITGRPGASGMAWIIPTDRRPAGIVGFTWDGGECSGGPGGYDMDLHRHERRPHPSGNIRIANLRLAGSGVRASLRAVGFAGGPLTLANLRFDGSADHHIEVADSDELVADQISFSGRARSGAHTSIVRTPARLRGLRALDGGAI